MRAGGFEPPRSFEHGHLKTARLPFRHARNGSDRINLSTSDRFPRLPSAEERTEVRPKDSVSIYRKAATARLDEFIGPKDRAVPLKGVHYTA